MASEGLLVGRGDVVKITRTIVESPNDRRVGRSSEIYALVWNILRSDPIEARPGTANVYFHLPLGERGVPSSLSMYIPIEMANLANSTAWLPQSEKVCDALDGEMIERKVEKVEGDEIESIRWS